MKYLNVSLTMPILIIIMEIIIKPRAVTRACIPCYLGGWDQKDGDSSPAWA
jgi:hypothetical protein